MKGSKLILAGDPLQLPPTIISSGRRSEKSPGKPRSPNTALKTTAPKSKNITSTKPSDKAAKPEVAGPNLKDSDRSVDEEDVHSTASSDEDEGPSNSVQPVRSRKSPRLMPPKSLEVTLFQRLERMYGPSIKRMLTIQYRCGTSNLAY